MNLKKTPTVLYDHQIFSMQKVGGVSRYFAELIKNVPTYGIETKTPAVVSENIYLNFKKANFLYGYLDKKISSRLIRYQNQRSSLRSICQGDYNILHPTYYSTYHLHKNNRPLVVTVYDMIHEIYPQYLPDAPVISKNKIALLNQADKIIAISETTKNDILKHIKIPAEKISVIHLASSLAEVESLAVEIPIQNFVLFVGERGGYKNFQQLLEAFRGVFEKNKDATLFCVGGGQLRPDELEKIESFGLKNRVFQKNLSERELSWAYKNAICFVFPSLYEGFGIPILESMASDTITILSNKSCFPEIAGAGANYFNSTDELTDLILQCYLKPNSFAQTKSEAQRLSRRYSWKITAEKTAQLYQSIC